MQSSALTLSLRNIAEHVFHSLSLGIIVFDPDLNVILRNQAATILLPPGKSIAEMLRETTVESKYQDWRLELREAIEARGQRHYDGITCRLSDTEVRMLNMVCTPLNDTATGKTIGGLLVVEDVTARLSMERRLAVSERAGGGRQTRRQGRPRAATTRSTGSCGTSTWRSASVKRARTQRRSSGTSAKPRKGLGRMVQILGELLEFSRSSYGTYDEANVNRFVEDAVNAMQDKAVRRGINLVCNMEGVMPGLRAGSNLFQVFCNLIKNAIDAMPDGGTLTVTTRIINGDVLVCFEDTGPGLPEDIAQIFQPFFTTKPAGQGTGLGLAICKDIIEKYGGRILAENRVDGGARFTVIVPTESAPVAAAR